MTRPSNPVVRPEPASGPARGCLAALATAGAVALAAAGLCALVAGTYRIAQARSTHWPAPWSIPASTPPSSRLLAARRAWGDIRARYRLKDLVVPA